MLKKTIEKTKDEGGKTYLVTTYKLLGRIIYQRTMDFALAIEFPAKA